MNLPIIDSGKWKTKDSSFRTRCECIPYHIIRWSSKRAKWKEQMAKRPKATLIQSFYPEWTQPFGWLVFRLHFLSLRSLLSLSNSNFPLIFREKIEEEKETYTGREAHTKLYRNGLNDNAQQNPYFIIIESASTRYTFCLFSVFFLFQWLARS